MSRAVVLGHSGYIGRRLVTALRSAGADVAGRSAEELDLTQAGAAPALAQLFDANDTLIVLSAIKKQLGDTVDVLAQNLAITMNVGRAIAARPVARIVFFSSAAVYGEDVPHAVITERTPVQPTSFYGIGKYAAERTILKTAGAASVVILRPALVYGPAEPAYYYGPSGFLRAAREHTPITLWGDGTERREFLFVDDVVEVTKRLAFGTTTGVLNVVAGRSYTYVDALEAVGDILGRPPVVSARPRTKDKVDHQFDNAALRSACAGFEFVPLAEGLRRTAAALDEPAEARA